ncbi:hypothetical protein W02_10880 [Nitrospira sp. KM1]|uniref:DUF1328 domain-containing protein n=1 Tax=Nitrospira sp. KM1 TaxID=1936990 RepID=UPI0013A76A7C|nr:DUF1328 domain-containing protein [Nitrospira sp. KM1]BCA53948.1 hypothetical protein W02_10880 [Nitrospira sp. KM1]
MLRWSVIFFGIAIVAAAFGFGDIAVGATEIAKVLFYMFLGVAFIVLILAVSLERKLGER